MQSVTVATKSMADAEASHWWEAWLPRPMAQVLLFIFAAGAYFLGARLSLFLTLQLENVAVLWPPAGLSVGLLIALGAWARVPVAAAVLVATIRPISFRDRASRPASCSPSAMARSAPSSLPLVWRFDLSKGHLEDIRSVIVFLLAAVAGTAIAAAPAALTMHLLGLSPSSLVDIAAAWLLSDSSASCASHPSS